MAELINKATTHTYVEEEKVWKIFYHCALRIGKIFHAMRLRRLRQEIWDVIRRAEAMIQLAAKAKETAISRPPCT